jgi:hypothetical protein
MHLPDHYNTGPILWVFDNCMKPPINIIGVWITQPPTNTPWPSEWEDTVFNKAEQLQEVQPLVMLTAMIASINSTHNMPTITCIPGHMFPTPLQQD